MLRHEEDERLRCHGRSFLHSPVMILQAVGACRPRLRRKGIAHRAGILREKRRRNPPTVQEISGKGADTRLLCAADEFCSMKSTTLEKIWRDASAPKAQAVLPDCVGGGVNRTKYDIPDLVQGIGTAEDDAVLDLISPITALRIEPPSRRPEGVTEVKLMRVLVRAGQGRMGLVIRR